MTLDVHLVGGGTDWTAIVGIAGVVGTLTAGLLGGWLTDVRRFNADRKLRSADDLVKQIDDVAVALDALGKAAVDMREDAVSYDGDPEKVGSKAQATQDAYHVARAAIARLRMRPHAGKDLVAKATDASHEYLTAYNLVFVAMSNWETPGEGGRVIQPGPVLRRINESEVKVDEGLKLQNEYADAARDAIEKLLGAPASS